MTTPDTIAAIATPPGMGGVGIVRVSGPQAPAIAAAILGRIPEPRRAVLGVFHESDGTFIDMGLALYFQAPHSFTGEDVLELQGHGGPVVMDLLLRRCLELGARLARPGEFSERAFLNGKLDLVQAEAVADLIESSTSLAARLAGRSLQGVFSQRIAALLERLIQLRLQVEAGLDFPDEELDLAEDTRLAADLHRLVADVEQLLTDAHQGQIIREGLAVVIAGAPNVGKSSLLNALCGTEAAIVTAIPGTTRDLLKFDIQVDGLPIRIIDTAGLRHSQDPVEREGVRRAQAALNDADLVLWVRSVDQEPDASIRSSFPTDCPVILIRNKIDLVGEPARLVERDGEVEIALSAVTGAGLELLRGQIKAHAGLSAHPEGAFIARRRHLEALERARSTLQAAAANLELRLGAELVAEELHLAQRALGEITGEFTSEDLLNRIFSSFCIGK
ncbi:tRNA uridine-5-carboxymethylaminomethyl(34) synthesis GTPase MnmE [Thermochromatium tepidum]|uniref:tRNA modification GTPase MnmE n=1 Tax=Thermochromatium tepidum ATCC 43061 TaxID=316276 RepID=A0A6I6EHM7_THETI|nr:tRNA uridine-5-carboxymethylaminomethyl(34) synthesis GTPase MnmE [Thermochromatium tepidum]QGU33760.1 tRNA uridine-5-carboxymethylaminomethyl(34) synthesis GTPase MnmE [Thermochromatium tepidum ATCC 43061]